MIKYLRWGICLCGLLLWFETHFTNEVLADRQDVEISEEAAGYDPVVWELKVYLDQLKKREERCWIGIFSDVSRNAYLPRDFYDKENNYGQDIKSEDCREFEFRHCQINEELLRILYKFPNISCMKFSDCQFDGNNVQWSLFQNLSYLGFHQEVPANILKDAKNSDSLRGVYISLSADNYKDLLSDCRKIPFLESVSINISKKDEDLQHIEFLKYLSGNIRNRIRYLSLRYPVTKKTVKYLHKFPNLRDLQIWAYGNPDIGRTITDDFILQISDIPLEMLQIPQSQITEQSIPVFIKWNTLKHLYLDHTENLSPSQIKYLKEARPWEYFNAYPVERIKRRIK